MAHRVPITIRLNSFEGPLDLLLYLIQSHELDISKISIARITDQYLAYVRLMQELNFDIASDFLVMAATLIQWKSKALLPQENADGAQAGAEDGELSPEALLRQLMEHQRFLAAGEELSRLTLLGEDVFTRQITRAPVEKVWKEMDVTQLLTTYQDLLVRERKRTTILKKETVSLATKITHFADRLTVGKLTGMSTLIDEMKSRPEVVVTFLASLELSRLKKMRLHQEGTYQEIYVELLESIHGFNTQLATGFDNIVENVDSAARSAESAPAAPAPDSGIADLLAGNAGSGDAALGAAELGGTSGVGSSEAGAGDSAGNALGNDQPLFAGPSSRREAKRAARLARKGASGRSDGKGDDSPASGGATGGAGAADATAGDGADAQAFAAGTDTPVAAGAPQETHASGVDLESFGESREPELGHVLAGVGAPRADSVGETDAGGADRGASAGDELGTPAAGGLGTDSGTESVRDQDHGN